MRLIGSKTEHDFEETLVKSHIDLFGGVLYSRLLQVLKVNFPKMKTAYFLKHIQEQGEDLYTLLVDCEIVVKIEIDRYDKNEKPIIKKETISDFNKGISKNEQIKLAVALNLANKDIQQHLPTNLTKQL